jgi:aminopeptidase YwaD
MFKTIRYAAAFMALCGCSDEGGREWKPLSYELDPDRIFQDTAYLASEALEGREPGTEGNQLACDYVESLFDELGVEPAGYARGYRQAFDFWAWRLEGTPTLSIDGIPYQVGDDCRVIRYSGSGQVGAEVVFAGYGLTVPPFDPAEYPDCPLDPAGYDDYAGLDTNGKVVLLLRQGPGGDEAAVAGCRADADCVGSECLWTFTYKARNAVDHGAAAVLFVQDYSHPGAELPNVAIGASGYDAETPVVFVNRDRIETALPDLPAWAAQIESSLTPASRPTGIQASVTVDAVLSQIQPENVLGAVYGFDPELSDQVVVIGAHVDHLGKDPVTKEIFYGADDNASGTAVMMELARLLRSMREPPARTVLFAGWNAEESGLIGSCYYVGSPTLPISDTLAAFAIDMVGAGDATGLALFGGTLPENQWLVDVMRESARRKRIDYYIYPVFPLAASDHACFADAGVPAMMAGTFGPHGTYHTPADTIDGILVDDLEVAATLMWAVLEPLAKGTEQNLLD